MHRKIKRFGMEGVIADDSLFTRVRTQYEQLLIDDLRDRGYVPVLVMGPYFATEFNRDKQHYDFVVSVYAVFVGERKAWKIEGIEPDSGMLLPRPTRPTKSKQSSILLE